MRIAPVERLASPPFANPEFLLAGARLVIAFMLPLNGDIVHKFLAGQDQLNSTRPELVVNAADIFSPLYRNRGWIRWHWLEW
jgi:hypothetical protein